jgi:PadR family transcriptional regulator, regulatory protein PadR
MRDVRLTQPTLKLLRFLLQDLRQGRSGAEIVRATGVGSGTLYPSLARLERAGWLKGEWEAIDPSAEGRPRRRFYTLTGLGQQNALAALSDLQVAQGEPGWAT